MGFRKWVDFMVFNGEADYGIHVISVGLLVDLRGFSWDVFLGFIVLIFFLFSMELKTETCI